jgi:phage FluMu protein Com
MFPNPPTATAVIGLVAGIVRRHRPHMTELRCSSCDELTSRFAVDGEQRTCPGCGVVWKFTADTQVGAPWGTWLPSVPAKLPEGSS